MAKTGRLNHTHLYERNEAGIWRCANRDGCTHHIPSNMAPAPMNRKSICWSCDSEFILTPDLMDINRPVCGNCRTTYVRVVPAQEVDIDAYIRNKKLEQAAKTRAKDVIEVDEPKDEIEVIEDDSND